MSQRIKAKGELWTTEPSSTRDLRGRTPGKLHKDGAGKSSILLIPYLRGAESAVTEQAGSDDLTFRSDLIKHISVLQISLF